MKSIIYLDESVVNKERLFGSIKSYYPCRIEFANGTISNALFTENQIKEATERAKRNPEDVPEKTFWESLVRE